MPDPRRFVAALAVAGLALAGLTACSGGADGGCTPAVGSGAQSQSVSAKGAFDTAPTVTFAAPLHTDDTQATTLIPGSGDPIESGQQVELSATLLDGTTGQVLTKTSYGASGASTIVADAAGKDLPGLQQALLCARVGERLVAVIPPSQGLQSSGGSTTTDSLVVVADVRRAALAKANGTPQVMSGDLPAVVLAASGQPGITLPDHPAPKTLTVDLLKAGSGAQVREGQSAVVQYTTWVWPAQGLATVAQSTWTTGTPGALTITPKGTLKGVYAAIKGQRIGSQVLAILPPADAYGSNGDSDIGVGPDATLVYVIDILGTS